MDGVRPWQGSRFRRTKRSNIMILKRLAAVVGALGLGALLTAVTAGRTQADLLQQDNPPAAQAGDQQPQNQDMDVLARGPIHEAYAEPVDQSPRATPVVPKEPP